MRTFWIAASAWLLAAAIAGAQPAAPVTRINRGDVQFGVGWQNLHAPQDASAGPYRDDWMNAIFYGAAGAGWYWTDNIKTQIDIGAGTRGRQYRYRQFQVDGVNTYESSYVETRERSVSVSQQYQFFRNAWVHPHVGAGLEFARQQREEQYQPVTVVDNVTHLTRLVSPARQEGPENETITRPFVEAGMKAYMTRRSFFSADARVMVRHGIDEVLFRLGFGFDF